VLIHKRSPYNILAHTPIYCMKTVLSPFRSPRSHHFGRCHAPRNHDRHGTDTELHEHFSVIVISMYVLKGHTHFSNGILREEFTYHRLEHVSTSASCSGCPGFRLSWSRLLVVYATSCMKTSEYYLRGNRTPFILSSCGRESQAVKPFFFKYFSDRASSYNSGR